MCQSQTYLIRIKGHLEPEWSDWLDGFQITLAVNGETLLYGQVVDQSALYGLLKKLCDIGLPLVSVAQVNPDHDAEQRDHNVSE